MFKLRAVIAARFPGHVSIPRSGFWVFKPAKLAVLQRRPPRFNPSVGILGVQAGKWRDACASSCRFQSLGRDSGCSSCSSQHVGSMNPSASRSFNPSVGILGVQAPRHPATATPPKMFQSLGRDSGCSSGQSSSTSPPTSTGFNPSVGILGVQAAVSFFPAWRLIMFQSLGRDSGCSSGIAWIFII